MFTIPVMSFTSITPSAVCSLLFMLRDDAEQLLPCCNGLRDDNGILPDVVSCLASELSVRARKRLSRI